MERDVHGSMVDRIKLALSGLLVIAGLAAFYVYSAQPTWTRVVMVLAGLIAAAGVAWNSQRGRELRSFTRDSIQEAKKVAWPDRKESLQTTAAVFGFVALMAIFLWIVDRLLEWGLYDVLLGWKHQ